MCDFFTYMWSEDVCTKDCINCGTRASSRTLKRICASSATRG